MEPNTQTSNFDFLFSMAVQETKIQVDQGIDLQLEQTAKTMEIISMFEDYNDCLADPQLHFFSEA
ncbi:MAG: hypothetical protein QM743_12360 [Chitinophagaceae bacterium]